MGIVYLLQPPEFIDTNIYKIGHSRNNNIQRCYSYGSNTVLHYTRICKDSLFIEKKLIENFKNNFQLVKGREYFEGEIDNMIYNFHNIFKLYNNLKFDEQIEINTNIEESDTLKYKYIFDSTLAQIKQKLSVKNEDDNNECSYKTNVINNMNKTDNAFICIQCKTNFNSRTTMWRHKKNEKCVVQQNEQVQKLKKEIIDLKIAKLEDILLLLLDEHKNNLQNKQVI
jgi:hypothetical protein